MYLLSEIEYLCCVLIRNSPAVTCDAGVIALPASRFNLFHYLQTLEPMGRD
jgi:hypothetical protein